MEQLLFLRRFLAAPLQVGSITPSSRWLVERMLDPVPWERCQVIAELGAGTGRITAELVLRARPGTRLLVFERDPVFRRGVAGRFPQVKVYRNARALPAAVATQRLGHVDAVLSGLPFTLLPPAQRERILDGVLRSLAPGGLFIAFQYSPHLWLPLRRRFRTVRLSFVWRNLPPAVVYVCEK